MKKLALSAVSLLTAFTLAGCTSNGETVATMKDGEITKDELFDSMVARIGESTLQQMVMMRALENVVGDTDEIAAQAETEMRQSMNNFGGEEQFLQALQNAGYASIEDFQDQIYMTNLMNEAVMIRNPISDEDIAAYFETYEPGIKASHILVDEEAKAKELIKKINDGADFAEVAKENSKDGSASAGGDLGEFTKGQMVAPFEEAAFALKEGEMTQTPVKSEHGYHIILVTEKPEKGTLEEETETIRERIKNERVADPTFINAQLSEILKEADVNIKIDSLKGALDPLLGTEEESSDSAESEASSEEASEEGSEEASESESE